MEYARTVALDLPYDEAVPKVKAAFQQQGFGTLTEIDVSKTLEEKLGEAIEPYVILGTCNPTFARRALDVTRDVGLLLPCNVVVRGQDGGVLVQALEPAVIAAVDGHEDLRAIADEAGERIAAALDTLEDEGRAVHEASAS